MGNRRERDREGGFVGTRADDEMANRALAAASSLPPSTLPCGVPSAVRIPSFIAYHFVLGPSANYTSASMYAMSRKVLGYNTWFQED